MLDYSEQLQQITDRRIELASKYAKARKAYGEVKSEIDILYASKMLALIERKKNLGYETGLLLLIAEEKEEGLKILQDMYSEMIKTYNNYKAIERMLDALDAKTMSIQSVMKYNATQDTFGKD
jgi:hypothetical protein